MNVLFVMPNGFYARFFASVITSLSERGHKVVVAMEADADDAEDRGTTTAANTVLRSYLNTEQFSHVNLVRLPRSQSSFPWGVTSRQVAALWDYSRYLLPLHQHAPRCAQRAKSILLPPMRILSILPTKHRVWAARGVARLCAWIQEILPPDRRILAYVRAQHPDIVLITPLIDLGSDQTNYVKACRRLRIPVGHCVASWDNLTNKGLIKAIPDRVFVWNVLQKTEAVTLHGVPENRIVVTGAQIFDHWFDKKPTRGREEFCAVAGLDPSKLILLYTASSVFICRNEVDFVIKWIRALRNSDDSRLREAGILIRPHPKATKTLAQWDHPILKQFENVVVYPRGAELSLARHAQDEYHNSLYHAAAVVGINTSAMIEASIVGRRSFTILLDEVRGGQEGMVHFQHLTRNGFLGVSRDFEEHIAQLGEELNGSKDTTSGFVSSFLRPYGIDMPATPIFVAQVEKMEGLPVDGPSLCARLGWLQRWLLLPLVAVVTLAGAIGAISGKPSYRALRPLGSRTRHVIGRMLRGFGFRIQGPVQHTHDARIAVSVDPQTRAQNSAVESDAA